MELYYVHNIVCGVCSMVSGENIADKYCNFTKAFETISCYIVTVTTGFNRQWNFWKTQFELLKKKFSTI